jgi:septal ring factor EnvC (AmiA/AmiB activator)
MDDLDLTLSHDERSHAPSPADELDRLSLVQALRDFEVANGRVIDLTQRLVVTAEELATTREQLAAVRAERDELSAKVDDLVAQLDELRETHDRTLQRKSVRVGDALWSAGRAVRSRRRG